MYLDRKQSRKECKDSESATPGHALGVERKEWLDHAWVENQRKQRSDIRERIEPVGNLAVFHARPPDLEERTRCAEDQEWKTDRNSQVEEHGENRMSRAVFHY